MNRHILLGEGEGRGGAGVGIQIRKVIKIFEPYQVFVCQNVSIFSYYIPLMRTKSITQQKLVLFLFSHLLTCKNWRWEIFAISISKKLKSRYSNFFLHQKVLLCKSFVDSTTKKIMEEKLSKLEIWKKYRRCNNLWFSEKFIDKHKEY